MDREGSDFIPLCRWEFAGLPQLCWSRGEDRRQQSRSVTGQLLEVQPALSLGGRSATEREQAAETPIAGPILGQQHHRGGVDWPDFGTDDERQADLTGCRVSPHDPRQTVAVGDRQRRQPQLEGPLDQFIGMRRPSRKEKFVLQCNSA